MNDKLIRETVWGFNDLMVTAAFRYCLGRRSYIVGACVDWLIAHWQEFNANTRAVIQRDLEQEFLKDDEARESGDKYRPLGDDCDRAQWERVRQLGLQKGASK